MRLSIIVIFHNMRREAARTLFSLSTQYQTGVSEDEYEVIAIDNGSTEPLDPETVTAHGKNFSYRYFSTESVSPARAMNTGAAIAKGDALAFIVDGARMASPGLIAASLQALSIAPDPFVAALAWHLGPDVQNISMLEGYNQSVEDKLLDSINWTEDGYSLFNISTLAQSSQPGILGGMPPECSWLCLSHKNFDSISGFDERFQSGGGGLVNQDIRNRIVTRLGLQPVVLLGEGVFHQIHGGVATNVRMEEHPIDIFLEEYNAICGEPFKPAHCPNVMYFGALPEPARRFIAGG